MFDISFGELILVLAVAVMFIGPKELPVVVRACARGIFRIKHFMHEVRLVMDELAEESGVSDIKREMEEEYARDVKMIRGDDGKWYEAYDISDFVPKNEAVKMSGKEQEP